MSDVNAPANAYFDGSPDPFLPPLLPTDNAAVEKKASSSSKTIGVWLVLMVVLASFYQLVKGPVHPHAPGSNQANDPSFWWTALTTWAPIVVIVGLIILWWRRVVRAQQPTPEQEAAMLAHLDGDHARARALWLEIAKKQTGNASYARVSQLNAATSAISLGDFDAARDELLAIEKGAGFLFIDGHRLLAASSLARLFVLRGELARARAWIRSTRQRLERYRYDRTHYGISLRLTESMLLAREGKHQEALQLLTTNWRRQLLGHEPSATLLLRGYLVARTNAPRTSGVATPWTDALRTIGYDISFLWKAWPDLEAFAVENGLASRSASAAHA